MKNNLALKIFLVTSCVFNFAFAKDQSADLVQSALNIKANIINTPQSVMNSKLDLNYSFANFNEYNKVISQINNLESLILKLSSNTNQMAPTTLETYKQLVIWSATTEVSINAFESRGFFAQIEKAPKVLRTVLMNNCDLPPTIKSILQTEFQRDIGKIKSDFIQLRTGSSGGGRHGSNRTLRTLNYSEAVNDASEINKIYRKISHASSSLAENQREVLSNLAMEISNDTYDSGDFGAYNVFQVFRNDSSTGYINAIAGNSCSQS